MASKSMGMEESLSNSHRLDLGLFGDTHYDSIHMPFPCWRRKVGSNAQRNQDMKLAYFIYAVFVLAASVVPSTRAVEPDDRYEKRTLSRMEFHHHHHHHPLPFPRSIPEGEEVLTTGDERRKRRRNLAKHLRDLKGTAFPSTSENSMPPSTKSGKRTASPDEVGGAQATPAVSTESPSTEPLPSSSKKSGKGTLSPDEVGGAEATPAVSTESPSKEPMTTTKPPAVETTQPETIMTTTTSPSGVSMVGETTAAPTTAAGGGEPGGDIKGGSGGAPSGAGGGEGGSATPGGGNVGGATTSSQSENQGGTTTSSSAGGPATVYLASFIVVPAVVMAVRV